MSGLSASTGITALLIRQQGSTHRKGWSGEHPQNAGTRD